MKSDATYLVTGGAGFIGTNFVKFLRRNEPDATIVVLDALTYSGNIKSLAGEIERGEIVFVKGDIADCGLVTDILTKYQPAYLINFAAESHVDRSLDDSRPFIRSNVEGTLNLLDCARKQRETQITQGEIPTLLKFVQISTDEVYGDLECDRPAGTPLPRRLNEMLGRGAGSMCYGSQFFSERSPLKPSSPYSASKASADLLALSFHRSFGMPVCVTRCSNNYGPYQHPEKLIPLMINNILERKQLPVYGRGLNVRDWIHVDDHCAGVLAVAHRGESGQIYNFGGYSERRNIDIVNSLIKIVGAELDNNENIDENLITFVEDRPGHDRRYAIDASKSMKELGWRPEIPFNEGLATTVRWYLANRNWLNDIVSGDYRSYYDKMYSNR